MIFNEEKFRRAKQALISKEDLNLEVFIRKEIYPEVPWDVSLPGRYGFKKSKPQEIQTNPPGTTGYEYIRILRETEKVWLVVFLDKRKEWIPKLLDKKLKCVLDEEMKILYIPFWLVEAKGL